MCLNLDVHREYTPLDSHRTQTKIIALQQGHFVLGNPAFGVYVSRGVSPNVLWLSRPGHQIGCYTKPYRASNLAPAQPALSGLVVGGVLTTTGQVVCFHIWLCFEPIHKTGPQFGRLQLLQMQWRDQRVVGNRALHLACTRSHNEESLWDGWLLASRFCNLRG